MDFGLFVILIAGILNAHASAQLLAPYIGPTGGLASLGLSPQALDLAEDTAANFLGMASGIVGKHFWEKQWKKPQTVENRPTTQ
ncbi:unnamed protein product [Cylicocyclus nassatus]|uniref:Holin n=1 Tax=Cylicocyclus nassatus TaxID=53992 RepID=A0AA36H0W4_CYLNA|nr:unnamed protein product [Cylicocyclus nassatus]